jgi:hypothetical protein
MVLECDEHYHRDREAICEKNRMIDIAQALGGPLLYTCIVNPDGYRPSSGPQASFTERMEALVMIKYIINEWKPSQEELEARFQELGVYMYYNGDSTREMTKFS